MKKVFSWIKEDIELFTSSFFKNKKILLPIMSGVLFVLFFGNFNIIILLLGLIAFVDYNTLYIPDILNYTIILYGLINTNILNILISIFLFFILFQYAKNKKLGFGDVKLLSGLGLIYGIDVFYIIIFSVIVSLIFERKNKIAFGYFLFWGTVVENIWFSNFNPFSFF
ncbi:MULTISPECIES: prepilin peptidase [unclassified Marinitoga]|uniref:prepilin peptidase n=1 Tax=unclassified Marinitoga TaxID=2640159 RepID=UPI001585E371|nr:MULTISPECIES: prepilin peptidase [unclassified Marinitoga]